MRRRYLVLLVVGLSLTFGATRAAELVQGSAPLDRETEALVETIRLDMPEALRPASVTVRVERSSLSAEGSVVAHPESASIVVEEHALPLSRSVWAHELGHLAIGRIRSGSNEERRMLEVLHEALADAIAAATTASPMVGDVRELRDLRTPPQVRPEYWMLLGAPTFDPHSAGWALASELWRSNAAHPRLLVDAVTAMRRYTAGAHRSPVGVLTTLVRACPASSRLQLGASLAAWSGLDLDNAELP